MSLSNKLTELLTLANEVFPVPPEAGYHHSIVMLPITDGGQTALTPCLCVWIRRDDVTRSTRSYWLTLDDIDWDNLLGELLKAEKEFEAIAARTAARSPSN